MQRNTNNFLIAGVRTHSRIAKAVTLRHDRARSFLVKLPAINVGQAHVTGYN